MSRRKLNKVKEIIIHYTATYENQNVTVTDVDNWHRQNGWGGIGYHYLIYLDGSIHAGTPETEVGAHCIGHNSVSIGICYVGGCKKEYGGNVGFDTRTPAQRRALVSLVKQLMKKYNLSNDDIHCHYEFAAKPCPGFSIESFRKELDGENVAQLSTPFRSGKPPKKTPNQNKNTSSKPEDKDPERDIVSYRKFKRGWLGGRTRWSISAPMGNRKQPNRSVSLFHKGIDVSTPVGTEIYSPMKGKIESFTDKTLGLCAILKPSDNDCWFYFGCLSEVIKIGNVKEGELFAKTGGDVVNDKENAGGSTGAHLHFEVKLNGSDSIKIDGKFFITDLWVNKITGEILASENENIPIITDNIEKNNLELTKEEQEIYNIGIADIIVSEEQDVSGETDYNETEIEEVAENNQTLKLEENQLVPGIWQIMKLVMDADVANLRVRDAATSLQQGSLINFFQKVCQQPFVEFFGDTYGDQYYFITRKPPFDKEGMKKTMVAQGLFDANAQPNNPTENDYKGKNIEGKTIYDIFENDIVSSNISFNNQNIYSWFQFIPIYELGAPSELQYLIPAVLFPEYAAIWGSKSLNIRSQYRNFQNSNISDKVKNGEKSEQGDAEVRHSIHDLKYIIESNAYNPFVRQGTITILGNRKIKRGVFIRVFWNSLNSDCPEIFYVENVSQNYSINSGTVNRTTTLTLSHGMLSNYMFDNAKLSTRVGINDKSESEKTTISYFNIIDFGEYENKKDKISMDDWRNIISKWRVNVKVFMFFLRKTQFIYNLSDGGVVVVGESKKTPDIL